jgi:hypothetical protein
MSRNHVAAQEAISEARAHLWAAVKLDQGRRAMEGDIEGANSRLETASEWLRRGEVPEARREISDALELLHREQSRLIAEVLDALATRSVSCRQSTGTSRAVRKYGLELG